jgi:5-deoxy-glucuronate isomerase
MPSPLLAKARRAGREIVSVTPERAGWHYVGFRALRLADGETENASTPAPELCVVVLTGRVDVTVAAQNLCRARHARQRVRSGRAGRGVRAAGAAGAHLRARRRRSGAVHRQAPGSRIRCACSTRLATMRRSVRGKGSNTRHVCDILPHDDPGAAHLLVVEVLTPAGHSSSYPPHKHDDEAPPAETQLEETYYHRLNPPQGFAFQRVYTDDRSLDEACAVEDHDVVMVPRGYHPVVAPHGYDLYYLNVMAGPKRLWVFRNDPAHEWMLR